MEDAAPRFAVDVVDLARLKERRDRKGADDCLENGFGKLRELMAEGRDDTISLFEDVRANEALREARRLARETLAAVCRGCPMRCKLAGR